MFDTNRCMNFDNMNNGFMMNDNAPIMDGNTSNETFEGVTCSPIYECPRVNVVNRTICHTVPHVIPCETKIINHHVYRHTYTPCYSMSECNTCENVYDNPCC